MRPFQIILSPFNSDIPIPFASEDTTMNKCIITVCSVALSLSSTSVWCQNALVRWSAFDAGFGSPSSGTSAAKSAVGQSFLGNSRVANTMVISGFLADTLLRGALVSVAEGPTLPVTSALLQNFPNPFNPSTTIQYEIPARVSVSLKVYDILGREVTSLVNGEQPPGVHTVRFDASNLSSGVYFYMLRAGDFIETKRLMILR